MKSACLFFACKTMKVHRSYQEICDMYNISTTLLSKSIKQFEKLNMANIVTTQGDNHCDDTTNFANRIPKYVNSFSFEKQERHLFIKRVNEVHEKCSTLFEGKSPKTIISSIICFLFQYEFKNKYTKKELSKILNISIVTLNKVTNLIVQHIGNL